MAYEGILGPALQAAESITAMRENRASDKLRQAYLGRQMEMQETQFGNQQEDRRRAQQMQDMQVLYNVATQVESAPDALQATRAVTSDPRVQQIMQRMGIPLQIPPDATPETMKQGAAQLRQRLEAFLPRARGEGFTLAPGAARFDANGNLIAERSREEPPLTPFQQEQLRLSNEQLRLQQDKDTRAADKDAREKAAMEEKNANRLRNLTAGVDSVLTEVDKAIAIVERGGGTILPATGFGSGRASEVRGSAAYKLSKVIETVKGNIGFDRLQAMRDASPTGGALGQVAIQELNALQNSIASLDQGLTSGDLLANLQKVRKHYENWKRTLTGEAPAQPGASSSPGQKPDLVYIPGQGFVDAAR